MAKTHITLILIKDGLNVTDIVSSDCKIINFQDGQKLYYKDSIAKTPKWVADFMNDNEDAKRLFKIQCVSAVMFFNRHYEDGDRLFAITFGFGRNLINPDAIEERFGLITALSSIGKEKIRSLDLSSLESILLNSRIQASSLSGIENFSLNINRDLLKAVTGKLEGGREAGSLTGKDSLGFSTKCTYRTIGTEIDKHYKAYKSGDYRNSFKWIDKINYIKDRATIAALDKYIVKRFNENQFDNIWISYPDIIDWNKLDHFKFGREDFLEDLDIQFIHDELIKKDEDKVDLDTLKSRKIFAYDSSDIKIGTWPLYKCLYVDYQIDGRQYFLHEGKWFKIDTTFVHEINEYYNNVPILNLELPEYSFRTEDEYNKEIAKDEHFFLMDKKLQKVDGDEFELCDVMSSQKELIHVKKFTSSAVLSHLFNQGLVSAECITDVSIRTQANRILGEGFKLNIASFNPKDYKVVFVIAKKNANPSEHPVIPFFSKVALQNVANTLTLIGYQYAIKAVPFTYVDSEKEEKKKAKRRKKQNELHEIDS